MVPQRRGLLSKLGWLTLLCSVLVSVATQKNDTVMRPEDISGTYIGEDRAHYIDYYNITYRISFSEQYQKSYFFNMETGISQWHDPRSAQTLGTSAGFCRVTPNSVILNRRNKTNICGETRSSAALLNTNKHSSDATLVAEDEEEDHHGQFNLAFNHQYTITTVASVPIMLFSAMLVGRVYYLSVG